MKPTMPTLLLAASVPDVAHLPSDNNLYANPVGGKGRRKLTSEARGVRDHITLVARAALSREAELMRRLRAYGWDKASAGRFEMVLRVTAPHRVLFTKEGQLKRWDIQDHQKLAIDAHTDAFRACTGWDKWDDNRFARVVLDKAHHNDDDPFFHLHFGVAFFAERPPVDRAVLQ